MLIRVNTSPLRTKYSVKVAWSLIGRPLRRSQPCLMCVVLTTSMSPSHLPVEKPFHVCAAIPDGWARPSM